MQLDRRWIAEHIPHAGRMCLLDEVLGWDLNHIRCSTSTHRNPDNPLRAYGRLGSACGIEYAAQAMAIHGALVAVTAPTGYIAAVRAVTLLVQRLDDIGSDLIARADRVSSDGTTALYEFSLSSAEKQLLSGRATIVFDLAATPLTSTPTANP